MTTRDDAFPPPPQEPPAPPRKRRELTRKEKTIGLVLSAVTLVAATAGVTVLLVGGSGDSPKKTDASSSADSKAAEEEPVAAETTEEEPEDLYNPDVSEDDFEMVLKVTDKQCFGSYGCNVSVRLKPEYTFPLWPEPGSSFLLTYEVRGGKDGPVIETLELTGAEDTINYLPPSPIVLHTANSSVKPTVKITELEEY